MDGNGVRRAPAAPASSAAGDRTVADWLNMLFATVRPADGSAEFSHEQVSAAVARAGGPRLSARTIGRLRRGELTNPTLGQIQALAAFFRVSPIGCFGPDARRRLEDDLAELQTLRDPAVRRLSMQLASLPPHQVAVVAAEVEAALGGNGSSADGGRRGPHDRSGQPNGGQPNGPAHREASTPGGEPTGGEHTA